MGRLKLWTWISLMILRRLFPAKMATLPCKHATTHQNPPEIALILAAPTDLPHYSRFTRWKKWSVGFQTSLCWPTKRQPHMFGLANVFNLIQLLIHQKCWRLTKTWSQWRIKKFFRPRNTFSGNVHDARNNDATWASYQKRKSRVAHALRKRGFQLPT